MALPIVRESLDFATEATLDCTANSITLTLKVDLAHVIRLLEEAKAALDPRGKSSLKCKV
jgi:hypothetical protein